MNNAESAPIIVLSAPTCAGKTTIAQHIVKNVDVTFATSATTREPRRAETHGDDYYFLTRDEFTAKIERDAFIEYESVHDEYYGTPKSELQGDQAVLLDIDVKGGLNVKSQYEENALLIFIAPPSLDVIRRRILRRDEHDEEDIKRRLKRAKHELTFQDEYDEVIINDELSEAKQEATQLVHDHLDKPKHR